MTYYIAINNNKCSCSWNYVTDKYGEDLQFDTEEEAFEVMVDSNYEGVIIEV